MRRAGLGWFCAMVALLGLAGLLLLGGCSAVGEDDETGAAQDNAGSDGVSVSSDRSGSADGDDGEADFETIASSFDVSALDLDYTDRDQDASYDDKAAVHISLEGSTADIDGAGASFAESEISITSGGTYVVTGELDDGQLLVNAGDDDKVQLVLSDADISNDTGPAIYVSNADKCFVTLAAGTTNTLADGSAYSLEDSSDEPYATLFSCDDLTLNGSGELIVRASYRHAICSKDDLVITGGSYTIEAAEDALRGRDCVKIAAGDFDITAGGDGIKSNNDGDATCGFVVLDGGEFNIMAGDDGVQAVMYLLIADATVDVTAQGDAFHSDLEMELEGATMTVDAGDDAFHAETVLSVDGATANVAGCYEGLEAEEIYINSGTVHIVASDDGINATSADLSGTDAADDSESSNPWRADERRAGGGMPDNAMAESGNGAIMGDDNCFVQVNGGYTFVDTGGDGIDCNGSIEVTGGVLLIDGPRSDADAAFDYDLTATITGGTVIMVGSTGMAQSFTGGTQPFAYAMASGDAGQSIAVVDEAGVVLASLTATKSFGMVLTSSPSFEEGRSYSLVIGGTIADANDDGYAEGTSTVSGGDVISVTASTTATTGYGGLDSNGDPRGPGQGGDIQNQRRDWSENTRRWR